MKWVLGIIASLLMNIAVASETKDEQAFVNINMTLELNGIEKAIQDTRQSLDGIGGALESISQSENLTPDQKVQLGDTINNLNQLVVLSKQSVETLPSAFQRSQRALETNSQRFLDDLRLQIIVIIGLVGVVIIAIIAAIFWFILRPMQSTLVETTHNISSMAGAIKTTAQALDAISNQQEEISQRLEAVNRSARKT